MAAIDALHTQAATRECIRSEPYARFVGSFWESLSRTSPNHFPYESVADYIRHQVGLLTSSMTYHVAEQMTVVTEWAAQGLPDETTLDRTDLPSDQGFLLLEEPVIEFDPQGYSMENKALLWHLGSFGSAQRRGLWVDIYSTTEDFLDYHDDHLGGMTPENRRQLRAKIGPLMLLNRVFIPFGVPVGGQSVPASMAAGAGNYSVAIARARAEGAAEPQMRNPFRWIVALFHLLNQKITDVDEEVIPAKVRASLKKKRVPGMLTTIRLRVITGVNPTEGESLTEWSRRWVVRGHWRRQPYGPRTDPNYQMIWIAPHVKGPEGMPLIVPDKVYTLTR